jgi:predicted O-methyltransferase YrrM
MTQDQWTAVDRYIEDSLLESDPALDGVLEASAAAGLPSIAVSPTQGKLLFVLARAMNATRILEIGTLGGYSGVWLARALPPDGRLVTIEADPKHAAVARLSFERAGLSGVVDLRIGRALDVLPQLEEEGARPFDFVFIDADKGNYPEYLKWAIRFCRRGGLIIADNVVRHGAVIDGSSEDSSIRGVRRFMDRLGADEHVMATAIQTVGKKGYDGLAFIFVAR